MAKATKTDETPPSPTANPTANPAPAAEKPKSVWVNSKRHRIVKTCAMLWGTNAEAALSRIIDEWQTANADQLGAALTRHLGE